METKITSCPVFPHNSKQLNMKRPNYNELIPKNNFQGTKPRYNQESYITALEKYIDYLEKQFPE